jgi:hypothetical protein
MRKPARPIPRGVSPAVDHRCSSHQSAAPVTGVTGCFWSSADRSCPARGPRRRRRQRPVRRPPAAVRCRCGAWRRKGYTPEYEKLAPTALKSREIRKFVGPITSTLSDLPPASTGLLEAATGRSGTCERERAGRQAPRLSPRRTDQANAAFGCSSPGPVIPAPPAWLPRIHPVQANAQLLNSAEH